MRPGVLVLQPPRLDDEVADRLVGHVSACLCATRDAPSGPLKAVFEDVSGGVFPARLQIHNVDTRSPAQPFQRRSQRGMLASSLSDPPGNPEPNFLCHRAPGLSDVLFAFRRCRRRSRRRRAGLSRPRQLLPTGCGRRPPGPTSPPAARSTARSMFSGASTSSRAGSCRLAFIASPLFEDCPGPRCQSRAGVIHQPSAYPLQLPLSTLKAASAGRSAAVPEITSWNCVAMASGRAARERARLHRGRPVQHRRSGGAGSGLRRHDLLPGDRAARLDRGAPPPSV